MARKAAVLVALAGLASLADAVIPVVGRKTGLNRTSGAIPERRNINALYAEDGPEFSLYIRAMAELQARDAHDPTSWFQIMGIHGYPPLPYDNEATSTTGIPIYCPHGEEIFATWHRHYVNLYEQTLGDAAMQIANSYPLSVRLQYQEAAERLRAPFWDWADDAHVPPVTTLPTITVRAPSANGLRLVNTTIENPLYSYHFPDAAMGGAFDFTPVANRTLRCPDASGNSQPTKANTNLLRSGLKSAVYNTFTRSTEFIQSMSVRGRGSSFEAPHGTVHVYAACGQQFSGVAESGFDPLFMLHHAQVDRLIALWQAMYPSQAMFNYTYSSYGTFTIDRSQAVTKETPLGPFYRSETALHTSESALSIWDYGYTYPGLMPWNRSASEMTHDVTVLVNSLYNPDANTSVAPASSTTRRRRSSSNTSNSNSNSNSRRALQRTTTTEYFAALTIQVDDFPRPCSMMVYLNDQLAGTYTMLGRPVTGEVHGEIPLQDGLKAAGLMGGGGGDKQAMLAAIQSALVIQFEKPDGSPVPVDSIGNYSVQIEQVPVVKPAAVSELPRFGLGTLFDTTPKLIDLQIGAGIGAPQGISAPKKTAPSFSLNISGLGVSLKASL